MLSQKSVLARLLSNENITVQQGNFQTAFFDTKQRLLGLPLWKQMSNDVYDLLVGHEIAHALYTPENFCEYEGYSDVPHSWTNIVEDIRIERKVLAKYPGLVGNFKRGYSDLFFDKDLFGVKGTDLDALSFMDRLNLYSKSRGMVEINFSEEEMPYVAKAMAVDTYQDVIDVCKAIAEWLGTEDEDEQDGETQAQGEGDETNESQDGDQSSGEGEDGDEEVPTDGQDGEGEQGQDETQGSAPELEEGDADEGESEVSTEPSSDLGEALTDVNFHQNQSELVDGSQIYVEGLTRAQMDASTVSYTDLAKSRQERAQEAMMYNHKYPESEYNTWLLETKKVVNLMVKEFEMRKAAYRSARARTATRGSLDVNKLHQYRYDDQLFKQVTQLADAKNHGMMMLIDYSGSMYHMLPSVLKQTLALAMFCKRVGIPFEVYGFTSIGERTGDLLGEQKKWATKNVTVTRMDTSEFVLLDLLSSSMKKREYDEAVRMMFWQSQNLNLRSRLESLGNTPLNAALMAMTYKIDDFRNKYAVDKMSLVTLTDGDSNYFHTLYGTDFDRETRGYSRRPSVKVNVGKRSISGVAQWGDNRKTTAKCVELVRSMGVTCVNYFICSNSYELNGELRRASNWDDNTIKAARKDVRKDGAAIFDENCGYNRRFVIDARDAAMAGQIDELDVDSDMTAAKIAKAFSKSNGSKKKSRLVTQKFAEMVA